MFLLPIAFKWCPANRKKNYKHLSNIKSDTKTKGEKKSQTHTYKRQHKKKRIAASFVRMDCATWLFMSC